MRRRVAAAAIGVGVAAVVTAGGVAVAGSGDDGPASTQYTPQQADAAKKAALVATGGGTRNSVESAPADGATYGGAETETARHHVGVRLRDRFGVVVLAGGPRAPCGGPAS